MHRYTFIETNDGLVELVIRDERSLMSHALADCVGTRPPRGAAQDGPSTYWIDEALLALQQQLEDGDLDSVASGNATYLRLHDGQVEARYDFDPEDSEVVERWPAHEVIALLEEWRTRTLAIDPGAAERRPPPPAVWVPDPPPR